MSMRWSWRDALSFGCVPFDQGRTGRSPARKGREWVAFSHWHFRGRRENRHQVRRRRRRRRRRKKRRERGERDGWGKAGRFVTDSNKHCHSHFLVCFSNCQILVSFSCMDGLCHIHGVSISTCWNVAVFWDIFHSWQIACSRFISIDWEISTCWDIPE